MRQGIITMEAVRCQASWRLKVLPARRLFNLYQTACSVSDNLNRQKEGHNQTEWEGKKKRRLVDKEGKKVLSSKNGVMEGLYR